MDNKRKCGNTIWNCKKVAHTCSKTSITTEKYFLKSGPMLRAISPKTDNICGLTERCIVGSLRFSSKWYIISSQYGSTCKN